MGPHKSRFGQTGEEEFVTLISVECKTYHEWQTLTLHHSWRQARLPGKLVRLVACPTERRASSKDFSDLPGMETYFHEVADSGYMPLNKPWGFMSWLREGGGRNLSAKAVIMIIDPDMVFYNTGHTLEHLSPLVEKVRSGSVQAIGSDFEYTVMGLRARNWELARHFGISKFEKLQSIGVPILLRKESLARLVRPYYEITKAIAHSGLLTSLVHDGHQPAPWITEMVGYTLAAVSLEHETQSRWPMLEAPQPPFNASSNLPLLVHYDHTFHLCNKTFGKFRYYDIDLLNCSVNASALVDLQPPSRAEVNSKDCQLCLQDGDAFGTQAACGLPGRDFSIFVWEEVHSAVSAWRSAHCP